MISYLNTQVCVSYFLKRKDKTFRKLNINISKNKVQVIYTRSYLKITITLLIPITILKRVFHSF